MGEQLGKEVGADGVEAYRTLKRRPREVVGRRQPQDRPPLTMLTMEIERAGGEPIEVEGLGRASGEELDDLLDAGEDLLAIAQATATSVAEPEKLTRLHFPRRSGKWESRYALDDVARTTMVAIVSEDDFAELANRARNEPTD